MAHVELPEEELQPLLESIQEAFKPLTKAMPLIMKIPEEIKRVADNISQGLESGVPEKVDNAVKKLTKDEAEMQLRKELADKHQEVTDELIEQLRLLRDEGIPAEMRDGKVVKLTEEEIKMTKESYLMTVSTNEILEKQKEEIVKSTLSADESAKALKEINDVIEKNNQVQEDSKKLLAGNLPEPGSKESGFVKPAFIEELGSTGGEALMAGPNAILQLKDSFESNVSTPLMSLIKMNKKHQEKMEDFGETGETADKLTIMKFLAIAAGIAGILAVGSAIYDYLLGDDDEPTMADNMIDAEQEAFNKAREEGKSIEEAQIIAQKAKQDSMYEQGSSFGNYLRDLNNANVITDENYEAKIEDAKTRAAMRNYKESDTFQALTSTDFTKPQTNINNIVTNNSNTNSIEEAKKGGASVVATISQTGG
tara:strand:+ start:209 stop:1480 length:1272 start_codon:yes stop_codon:yes gene_type:complete